MNDIFDGLDRIVYLAGVVALSVTIAALPGLLSELRAWWRHDAKPRLNRWF